MHVAMRMTIRFLKQAAHAGALKREMCNGE
jgi:hypothetical protein